MRRLSPSSLAALLLACAAGCTDTVTLTDDIDLTWDFSVSSFDAELHTPYVRGASVGLSVSTDDDGNDLTGWSVTSDAPDVFRVGVCRPGLASNTLQCDGHAAGEGTAALTVRDEDGDRVGTGTAEVLVPDRVVLEAHGYLLIDRAAQAPVTDVRILAGGTATYHVRYFRGGRELHGNGVLSAEVPPQLTASPRTTFLFENREWLTIAADAAPGAHSIPLFADGVPLGSQPVEIVPETAIDRISLELESVRDAEDGDRLVALAQAFDADDRRIFGVDYEWTAAGIDQLGDGDLLRYTFEPGASKKVTASRGEHRTTATLQAESGSLDIGSTNTVGCAAGGSASGGLSLAGLALVGVIGRRRRQRR